MSNKIFEVVKTTQEKRNVFDLSGEVKMSGNMGWLMPCFLKDLVPGDKIELGCETLVRFAPMVFPVMHYFYATIHYFAVPHRILWPNWEDWITNTKSGSPAVLPAHPYIPLKADGSNYTRLCDYLGLPDPAQNTGAVQDEIISAFPFAVYQKVVSDYYRDENLVPENWQELVDGDNSGVLGLLGMHNRAYEHDYFTACLPFAQKGDVVDIPMGDVKLKDDWSSAVAPHPRFLDDTGNTPAGVYPAGLEESITGGGEPFVNINGSTDKLAYDPSGTLYVAPGTINDLRLAYAVQRFAEKLARGGSRYGEYIRMMFGIMWSDKRLQRAEYITGVKTPITISEVLQTGETASTPQGNMAGHGVGLIKGKYGSYFAEEHCHVIGIMSILPATGYQQGIDKMWLKINDPTELFNAEFQHLGEQEVKLRELYAFTVNGGGTFGYMPRFAEDRFTNNRVAGQFRTTLKEWHLSRIFGSEPALNEAFIQCESGDTQRIFADTDPDEDKLFIHHKTFCLRYRGMGKFGIPTY